MVCVCKKEPPSIIAISKRSITREDVFPLTSTYCRKYIYYHFSIKASTNKLLMAYDLETTDQSSG